jgi:hypothetical protein
VVNVGDEATGDVFMEVHKLINIVHEIDRIMDDQGAIRRDQWLALWAQAGSEPGV